MLSHHDRDISQRWGRERRAAVLRDDRIASYLLWLEQEEDETYSTWTGTIA